MNSFHKTFQNVWLWSLGFFILAAFTGFLYRMGMFTPLPFDLINIRHAHSHLMFFNWVVPIPFLFIARHVVMNFPSSAGFFRYSIYATMALGFAAYPFFLMNGYRPVHMLGAELPLSVILSGLVMICWYGFIAVYIKHRRKMKTSLPFLFYDAALLMLGISSLGAWGVSVVQFSGIDNPMISTALTHFFLTTFTEGWCILAALGIIVDIAGIRKSPVPGNWLIAPILLGVPLMFPFGMSAGMLTDPLLMSARAGALLVATGLALNVWVLVKKTGNFIWLLVLALLGLKVAMQFGAAALPSSFWVGEHGLRIFYLHLLLLGFVSLTFFTAHYLVQPATKIILVILYSAILLVLISLVMLSGYWPEFLMPPKLMLVITWIAILPAIAALPEWITRFMHHKRGVS